MHIDNPDDIAKKLTNYGSLFMGDYACYILVDYCADINHALPTNFAAKCTRSPGINDYIKI